MAKLVLFNKPYNVLCQFSGNGSGNGSGDDGGGDGVTTLAEHLNGPELKNVYPAGRLDKDSEGLLLLTDNGALQHQIAHPKNRKPKTYWVQVDGDITPSALEQLAEGVVLKDGPTKPAIANKIDEPDLWPRSNPVRYRANIPTSWLCITITEGRNRQVRRMCAAVGFPCLRLVRYAIADWSLDYDTQDTQDAQVTQDIAKRMQPGDYRIIEVDLPKDSQKSTKKQAKFSKNSKRDGKTTFDQSRKKRRNSVQRSPSQASPAQPSPAQPRKPAS